MPGRYCPFSCIRTACFIYASRTEQNRYVYLESYTKIVHRLFPSPSRGGGGGGIPGICGAFDFSEEFLVKIPTLGPKNLIRSDQISPT